MRADTLIMTPGGFWRRVAAAIIDSIIMGVANIGITAGVTLAIGENLRLSMLVSLLATCIYYVLFLSSRNMATPGKQALGLQVITVDGDKLTAFRALGRFIAYGLPSIPVYIFYGLSRQLEFSQEVAVSYQMLFITNFSFAVGIAFLLQLVWFLPIGFTAEKRGVHDFICGTRVIRNEAG